MAGVYLGGSLALGDYVPGRSDIDITVLSHGSLADAEKEALVAALELVSRRCPARGLELVVYTTEEAGEPPWPPLFELNVNTGPRVALHVAFDARSEPAHWFAIDLAILRARARPLVGPPAADAFGSVPRGRVVAALERSLAWHEANEPPRPRAS